MKYILTLMLLTGCSLSTVRKGTTSTWAAGIDLALAAGAVSLARDAREEDAHVWAFAGYAVATYLVGSAGYGLARTALNRRGGGGAWDWLVVPTVIVGIQAARDLERIRTAIDEVAGGFR